MSKGEAPCAIATPKPMKNLAEINMDKLIADDWSTTPRTMMMHPIKIPARLPKMSAIYGTKGIATIEPTAIIAFSIPRIDPDG